MKAGLLSISLLVLFASYLFFPLSSSAQVWSETAGAGSVGNIIFNNCTKCHHPGAIGSQATGFEWTSEFNCVNPFTNYQFIKNAVSARRMPPWMPDTTYKHYIGERVLNPQQIQAIVDWANSSPTVTGDPPTTPPTFPTGSELTGNVVSLQHPTYMVSTASADEYRNFAYANTTGQDIYITKIEFIIPADTGAAAVHHIGLFIDETGDSSLVEDAMDPLPGYEAMSPGMAGMFNQSVIYFWVPGSGVFNLPCNFGFKLEANKNLVAQFHYPKRSGGPRADSTIINIEYETGGIRQVYSTIMPGSGHPDRDMFTDTMGNFTSTDDMMELALNPGERKWIFRSAPLSGMEQLGTDSISVLAVMPHMHLRGRQTEVYASNTIHGADHIKLVKINNWRFKWQETFVMQQPVIIDTSYTIFMQSLYDNSSGNPDGEMQANALYLDTVMGGMFTHDEMMLSSIIWAPYQPGDETMVMDPALADYVQADAGGMFNPHGCATVTLGGDTVAKRGTPPYNYQWQAANGISLQSGDTGPYPVAFSGTSPVNYILTVTDAKGCKAVDTASVAPTTSGFFQLFDGHLPLGSRRVLADVEGGTDTSVYCVGWFNKNVNLSTGINLDVSPQDGIFVAKYTHEECGRVYIWQYIDIDSAGAGNVPFGNGREQPYAGNIAVDTMGNVYCAFHAFTNPLYPNVSFFVKFDDTLGVTWVDNHAEMVFTAVESDPAGNIFISGFNNSSANDTFPITGGGAAVIPPGQIFIARVNLTATSFECSWVTTPGYSAATDGIPSIACLGNTVVFNCGKYLSILNSATGNVNHFIITGITPASSMSRLAANSVLKKIYTIDENTLRIYSYADSPSSIIATPVYTETIGHLGNIAGNRNTPYFYLLTDISLQYRDFTTGALVDSLPYTDTRSNNVSQCLQVDRNLQKVYMGGTIPQAPANITVNGYSFTAPPDYASLLVRANWGTPYDYGKTDETAQQAPNLPDGTVPQLKIYPNPVTNLLYVESTYPAGTLIKLYNMLGEQQQQFTLSGINTYSFDISALSSGAYIVKAQSAGSNILNARLVKY